TLKITNENCSLQPLVNCPFGYLFQVENRKEGPYLSRFIPSTKDNDDGENRHCQIRDETKDNRAIIDNNNPQSLSGEDIDAMRRQGATADEMVEIATFKKITSFSQEKYRLRKQKKYAPRILLGRPTFFSICEAYFKKFPTII
ncbi:Gcd10p domain-containing protein, partial [Cephalotus follicularis]